MSKLKQEITKESVIAALTGVSDEESGRDIISAGIVSSIVVKGDSVGFALEVDINKAAEKESLRQQCEAAVRALKGVGKVTAVLTSSHPGMLSAPKAAPQKPTTTAVATTEPAPAAEKYAIPGVKKLILVASGKGGVGKSTIAVNLARALAASGKKTGLVDVDIYGPSVPKMLGLSGKMETDRQNRMIPKDVGGIKSVSVGYLIDEKNALIWRSSMALKAMTQLLRGVDWGDLDYLIVDTPPGTGDIQLSLIKYYQIDGVVLVSTPQDVALLDVRKAANMFLRTKVPVLGIVENMSYFIDPAGLKHYIFGEGGAQRFAAELKIPFLGEVPISQDIREAGDAGVAPKESAAMAAIATKVQLQAEQPDATK